MRTKTLLMALAVTAAGVLASNAQTVYSANIVGYVNVPSQNSGTYYMLTCPFNVGASNGANEVFGTSLPDFTQLLTWNVGSQSYVTTIYDSTQPVSGFSWYAIDDSTPVTIPTLKAGQGFFLLPGGSGLTNTFVGTVAVAVGTTNNTILPSSGTYYMLGSVIPYAGSVTNGTAVSGGINLNGLPDFSQVLTWSVPLQSYVTTIYDSTQPVSGVNWYQIDDSTPSAVPSLKVGEGFFVLPSSPYKWTQGL
jgi:hypothetical protein